MGSHGPKASCVTWEVQIPDGKGQFWWIGAPIAKYRHCAKTTISVVDSSGLKDAHV